VIAGFLADLGPSDRATLLAVAATIIAEVIARRINRRRQTNMKDLTVLSRFYRGASV
jgi:hypothetical protein